MHLLTTYVLALVLLLLKYLFGPGGPVFPMSPGKPLSPSGPFIPTGPTVDELALDQQSKND